MGTLKTEITVCSKLSDQELWEKMKLLARAEREDLASFLIHLGEINKRDLHLRYAYSGLFRYLRGLGYSEWESRARSIAAVEARKYPRILGLVRAGKLNLTSIAMVGPHLDRRNYRALLGKACRRSMRELEMLVAELAPEPRRRDTVRVVSVEAATPELSTDQPLLIDGAAPPSLAPPQAASARLRYSFDADAALDHLLVRARGLLRHKYPFGEMEHILRDALNALLERIDPERRIARQERRQGG